jgi:hypothetical protein
LFFYFIDYKEVCIMADRLNPGESLSPNKSIISQDGRFTLILQSDGNLVLYWTGGTAIWSTSTVGRAVTNLFMQDSDGNLVINGPDGPVWASNTVGHPGAFLIVQNDGNAVVYEGGTPLWATNTVQTIANPAIKLQAVQDNGRFIEVTGSGFTPNQTVNLDYLFKIQSDVNTSTSGTETLTSDGTGKFYFSIRVTLVDISSAQVKATDVASGAAATALLEGM